MIPAPFSIDPHEWVTVRKALRILQLKEYLIYKYFYNYVFDNVLFIDGNLYFNIHELEKIKERIRNNENIIPRSKNYTKYYPEKVVRRNDKTWKDGELYIEPITDIFLGNNSIANRYKLKDRKTPSTMARSFMPDAFIMLDLKDAEDQNEQE